MTCGVGAHVSSSGGWGLRGGVYVADPGQETHTPEMSFTNNIYGITRLFMRWMNFDRKTCGFCTEDGATLCSASYNLGIYAVPCTILAAPLSRESRLGIPSLPKALGETNTSVKPSVSHIAILRNCQIGENTTPSLQMSARHECALGTVRICRIDSH